MKNVKNIVYYQGWHCASDHINDQIEDSLYDHITINVRNRIWNIIAYRIIDCLEFLNHEKR